MVTRKSHTATKRTATANSRALAERWGGHKEIFEKGFVGVPSSFLHHYAQLKPHSLTTGEMAFVVHLMEFKWDADHPFPGYKILAQRMGVSAKMTRRHAQSLEIKGYLKRELRIGQTNRFDLTPLFDALKATVLAAQKQRRKQQSAAPKRP